MNGFGIQDLGFEVDPCSAVTSALVTLVHHPMFNTCGCKVYDSGFRVVGLFSVIGLGFDW
jgi:hypothetical protein